MKKLFILCALACISCTRDRALQEELRNLDNHIAERYSYRQEFDAKADGISYELTVTSGDSARWVVYDSLYHHYVHHDLRQSDLYAKQMRRCAVTPSQHFLSNLASVSILALREVGYLAEERFAALDTSTLSKELYHEYLCTGIMLYTNLARGATIREERRQYSNLRDDFKRRLLSLDSTSVFSRKTRAQLIRLDGKMTEALNIFVSLMDEDASLQEKAAITNNIATTYGLAGDRKSQKIWLARSAVYDFKAQNRDYMSLYQLALLLYEDGDVKRADRYIQLNLLDVIEGGYNARIGESGKAQLMIGAGATRAEKENRFILTASIIAVSVLFGIILILYIISRKQSRNLDKANSELSDANKIKDNYVFRYMALSVGYLEKQEEFRKRMLSTAKEGGIDKVIKELRDPTENYEAYKDYFRIFDETFLGIYPDFVKKVNTILKEEYRYGESVIESSTLPTDLRILAAIRIGITDSGKIATFLKCSPATIYTYRTKLRRAALCPKDELDTIIRQL